MSSRGWASSPTAICLQGVDVVLGRRASLSEVRLGSLHGVFGHCVVCQCSRGSHLSYVGFCRPPHEGLYVCAQPVFINSEAHHPTARSPLALRAHRCGLRCALWGSTCLSAPRGFTRSSLDARWVGAVASVLCRSTWGRCSLWRLSRRSGPSPRWPLGSHAGGPVIPWRWGGSGYSVPCLRALDYSTIDIGTAS